MGIARHPRPIVPTDPVEDMPSRAHAGAAVHDGGDQRGGGREGLQQR